MHCWSVGHCVGLGLAKHHDFFLFYGQIAKGESIFNQFFLLGNASHAGPTFFPNEPTLHSQSWNVSLAEILT